MGEFGNNLSLNILSKLKNIGKHAKEILSKHGPGEKQVQKVENVQDPKTTVSKSLINTNSNVPVNQPTVNSPQVTQSALNSSSEPQVILTSNMKASQNVQNQTSPTQVEFQGPKDLPPYAGIANMSLKSWVASQETKTFAKTDSGEKLLTSTLEGIKGFQRKSYDPSGEHPEDESSPRIYRLSRGKGLLLLSHIFSALEKSALSETELLININSFKKLGQALIEGDPSQKKQAETKLSPPIPDEFQNLDSVGLKQIKFLNQLLALPKGFPEGLRLFAKEGIQLSERDLHSFLTQRLHVVQEQVFGLDNFLSVNIANFAPLLNQADYPLMLPLLLLYYPLPLPHIKHKDDDVFDWQGRKKEEYEENVLAACEIYYMSKTRGRFLLRFKLSINHELSLTVQTSSINNGIVSDIEKAVSESMYLIEYPPNLSDLNIFLTKEIYKATDIDEELSIMSTGPLRIEIILAAYAALVVLNKLNEEPDPHGLIEMLE